MSTEEIIEELGSFGYWQRIIFFTLCLPDIFFSFSLLLPVFTGSAPKWRCSLGEVTHNTIENYSVNSSIFAKDIGFYGNQSCECPVREYDTSFSSIVSEWDLVCGQSYVSDLITSIQMTGLLLGAAVFGQLSDLFGRKKTHFLTVAVGAFAALISAFSVNWEMYAVFRFILGVGCGGYFCINCVYPLEFVGRGWRTLCGTLGYWAIGQMILALMAYLIYDWRHLTIATSIAGFVFFPFWWLLPESPRWLATRGRIEDCKAIYLNIAKKNKLPVPDLSQLDHMTFTKKQKTKKYTYLNLFETKSLAKMTLIVVVIWFTGFVTYYEMSFNLKNLSGNRYINMLLGGCFDLVSMLSVILLNNTVGRRNLEVFFMASAAICNLTILIFYVTNKADELAAGVKAAALIGKACSVGSTYVTQIWTAELYPTHIRNLGIGLSSVAGRIGTILAPQIVFLGQYYTLAPYIFITTLCCLVTPLCFLVEETSGKALQDGLEIDVIEVHNEGKDEKTSNVETAPL